MTFTDPTSGAGYAFGEELPCAHMRTVATSAHHMLDGGQGGSYEPTAAINISGAHGLGDVTASGEWNAASGAIARFLLGSILNLDAESTLLPDVDNVDISYLSGTLRHAAVPTGARNYNLVDGDGAGKWIVAVRPAAGAFDIIFRRKGGGDIVTMPASTACGVLLYNDGSQYRLGLGFGVTAGPHA